MQNVIVGTAGHVDHGKTCLIKALSGIDTDRLKEEKKRGITIELGFASILDEPDVHIGIIDVPGHEKFVKNMLAGIGGIDLVLLVIALDEGIMPQTVEHFEILKMLQIRQGIIVLTKSDMVEPDWADMVEEEVDELVKGSFLEHAEKIRVSAYTGENVQLLKEKIIQMARTVGKRREEPELFRLPIDRIFTMEGFGTVITGTLVEGSCRVGDRIMVYPGERIVKIRGIESHDQKEEVALAGQRTALNLTGIKKEELKRGDVLAFPDSITESRMVDAYVKLFDSAERRLKNGDRVHVSFGSAQMIGKVVLLDKEELEAGEECFVQLRFDEPVYMKRKDHFILRFYSPVETFGGGIVLNPAAGKHKRNQTSVIEALRLKKDGSDLEILKLLVEEESRRFPNAPTLARLMNLTAAETEELLEKLRGKKQVLRLNDDSFVGKGYWEHIAALSGEVLERFHQENPLLGGMDREEFKSRLSERLYLNNMRKAETLLGELEKRKTISVEGSAVSVAGFEIRYSAADSKLMEDLEGIYQKAGIEVPTTEELLKAYADKKVVRQVLMDLTKKGVLVKVGPTAFMHKTHWDNTLNLLKEYLQSHSEITLAEFRDMLGTSRKYAMLILETYDQMRITRKKGDVRVLY